MMSFSENNSLLPGKIRNTGINIYLTSPLQRWVYIELFPKLSLLIPIRYYKYGTNITINDGDRITGDTADPSGNLYGVMTPAGNTPGNINLGNDVTVNVNDASGYAKGIIIQGKNSSLTANRLTVDVVGQTSAIGINLIGDYTHADLGTGSTIKSNDDGIIIGHSSTLTATQFTIENSK
ncbi:hypothetical protein ACUOCP_20225, partial [Escherichia sp. R-CC3]